MVVSFADAFTSVCVLATPALLGDATATEGPTVYLLSGFFLCYSVSDKFGVQANIGEKYAHLRQTEEDLGSEVVFRMDDEWSALTGFMSLTYITTHFFQFRFAVTVQSWLFALTFFKTWNQELFPGLLLLTFMAVHLFQFRFAVADQYLHY